MGISNRSFSVENEIVVRAFKIINKDKYKYGTKLSPIVNKLLKEWCDRAEIKV